MSGEHPSLVDTNVLVYAADESAPQYEASKKLLDAGVRGEIALCVAPQVLLEYVSVVTNPKRVSVASSVPDAWSDVETFLSAFTLVSPGPAHLERVVSLARDLGIGRTQVYDLALAVTMLESGVDTVYTYDSAVFSKITGIAALTP